MSKQTEVVVEVWPVSADPVGLWLVSGEDAWRSDAVMQDSDPHTAVTDLLAANNTHLDVKLLHSTSWRADEGAVVLTYVAVIGCSEFARDDWPNAKPISPALPDVVGKPISVEATEAPIPRYIDVLMHGLRHLQFLLQTDSTARAALCDSWRAHLEAFRPALAGMYDYEHGEEPITLPNKRIS
ncbi:hypothetical protein Aple_073670 [Acrocarpospora pleiomorpha]|uniref:Uncharacterized protein n=1 Tax=Acrocarpospora pleiomorpha TaxID=90975 RepID=A0A5M3Y175_9ACTN|nr:hypothetical protein [Acrocarpospora pleiomorpha]GES24468.1 hypothetical protein Aple_073670 [Acrocarpospora pleiomorpha]